jgi:hypothetical protein
MIENARQGFYNGSPVPLGYKTVEVDKRGARIKKKLAIDPVEAETIKLIFRLYRLGDGTSGPLRVKHLTSWLNERGYRTRLGARYRSWIVWRWTTAPSASWATKQPLSRLAPASCRTITHPRRARIAGLRSVVIGMS